MVNVLIALSHYLFNNFGLAVIVLTVAINLVMLPLTLKQIHASKAMQDIQPKLAELQKKYARDRKTLAHEQMMLYRKSGMSPAGCVVPMLIQTPIWIALYQAIVRLLAITPEDFLGLSRYLYSWPIVYTGLPLVKNFLGLNLATPNVILAILVGVTMWLQQKMVSVTPADPSQQTQSKLMLWMMPLMFAYMTVWLPSGLALFWVMSSVIRIIAQYLVTGWGELIPVTATKQASRDRKYKR